MVKILMVCLGNICRSPLAHGILESKLPSDKFYIDSAGTANYHVGEAPDRRSIAVAKSHGIDISHQRGQQFKASFFDAFDHIYVMDEYNFEDVIRLARNDWDRSKVKLILEEDKSINLMHVPDPYYGDENGFEYVFNILNQVCDKIAQKLQQ
ncbi:MAG TPA: low molecular weight protein-tyrosine-phosphatase [Flavobacteriaceae bacterium]|jgi:protein-tyrosine phosphatase